MKGGRGEGKVAVEVRERSDPYPKAKILATALYKQSIDLNYTVSQKKPATTYRLLLQTTLLQTVIQKNYQVCEHVLTS